MANCLPGILPCFISANWPADGPVNLENYDPECCCCPGLTKYGPGRLLQRLCFFLQTLLYWIIFPVICYVEMVLYSHKYSTERFGFWAGSLIAVMLPGLAKEAKMVEDQLNGVEENCVQQLLGYSGALGTVSIAVRMRLALNGT
jgi:hypothetical protein